MKGMLKSGLPSCLTQAPTWMHLPISFRRACLWISYRWIILPERHRFWIFLLIHRGQLRLTICYPIVILFKDSDFVLIHTGWSRYWGLVSYNTGYPVLSGNAADWICGFNLKGLGVDAISVDPPQAPGLPVHHRLLKQQMIIVENLNRLQDLPQSGFVFLALPLKIRDGDGSPVRAVAMT